METGLSPKMLQEQNEKLIEDLKFVLAGLDLLEDQISRNGMDKNSIFAILEFLKAGHNVQKEGCTCEDCLSKKREQEKGETNG